MQLSLSSNPLKTYASIYSSNKFLQLQSKPKHEQIFSRCLLREMEANNRQVTNFVGKMAYYQVDGGC
jgi:hypothetical protein